MLPGSVISYLYIAHYDSKTIKRVHIIAIYMTRGFRCYYMCTSFHGMQAGYSKATWYIIVKARVTILHVTCCAEWHNCNEEAVLGMYIHLFSKLQHRI